MRAFISILLIGLSVATLAAQTDIGQEVAMSPNSYATGKLAALRDIYLISAPNDADTPEAAAARTNRRGFGLRGYESILRSFREQHDALAARYNSQVAQALAAGQVPDPASFIAQLDALVYSTMNQIRLMPRSNAARQARMSDCFKSPCRGIGYMFTPGAYLEPEQSLWSDDRVFRLTLHADGALVLHGPKGPVWSSGVQGTSPSFMEMRLDGNLVIYDASGNELWASGTSSVHFSFLKVTNTGTVVIQDGYGRTLWSNGVMTPQQSDTSSTRIRTISGFTRLTVQTTGGMTTSSPANVMIQTIQISGIARLSSNYCQDHLAECATVAITPRFDNRLESEGHVAGGLHMGTSGGVYSYFNEESSVVLPISPPFRSISSTAGVGFEYRAVVVEDCARTGHGYTPAEFEAMRKQNKASVCFAVTYPQGAEVYVDGLKAGVTPLGFSLIRHDTDRVVTVQLPGYKTVEKKLMPDGSTFSIGLTLEKDSLHSRPK
jgi:hypothetical protein